GKRFDTNSETKEMGAYGLLNLTGRYVVTPALAVEARLDNLLDKRYETAKGFGTPRMGAFVGLRYTPR
ncbi:MAG: TonB-dependent receptor, partial [Aquabacterium sp.]